MKYPHIMFSFHGKLCKTLTSMVIPKDAWIDTATSFNYLNPEKWFCVIPLGDKFCVRGYNVCDVFDDLGTASEYIKTKLL